MYIVRESDYKSKINDNVEYNLLFVVNIYVYFFFGLLFNII